LNRNNMKGLGLSVYPKRPLSGPRLKVGRERARVRAECHRLCQCLSELFVNHLPLTNY